MKSINIKRVLITVGIILVLLFMMGITYLHFNYKKDIIEIVDLNNNIDVKYSDTSNVTFVNAKKGDIVSKTFTVKNIYNKSLYYRIILSNVTNNFDNNSLSYSLDSDNGAYIKQAYIIDDNYILSSLIRLDAGKQHTYSFNIKIVADETNNKTFSSNIKVDVISIDSLYENNSLYAHVINDNNIKAFKNINEDVNGVYYTNNSINGNMVYFYRGNNDLNNNVIINNYCYKIIRTTEDIGVKLIYNGVVNNGVCNNEENTLELSKFNNNSNYNAYVGYMYGSPNSSNYITEHENNNISAIMKKVNEFYQNNLVKYSSLIQDTIYCSNRKTASFVLNSVKYSTLGYKNYNTGYQSMYRLLNDEVSYACENINDRLNSNKLSYSIGLLTSDEAEFAGLNISNENKDNYLYSSNPYWTMSPAYYNGINAYNFIIKDGKIIECEVNKENYIRPVITLKKDAKVKSGNGSINSPYVIE